MGAGDDLRGQKIKSGTKEEDEQCREFKTHPHELLETGSGWDRQTRAGRRTAAYGGSAMAGAVAEGGCSFRWLWNQLGPVLLVLLSAASIAGLGVWSVAVGFCFFVLMVESQPGIDDWTAAIAVHTAATFEAQLSHRRKPNLCPGLSCAKKNSSERLRISKPTDYRWPDLMQVRATATECTPRHEKLQSRKPSMKKPHDKASFSFTAQQGHSHGAITGGHHLMALQQPEIS
ncbi:hypothetical protein Nepgr_018003 [Nepenthes gracilis]|uniref:Uncharacterized protein n=1 Tax=Nepenthes gracilis TaxID=150966 RepID=A0AAD3SS81_NEPGR|nr:hypothetical protein Nepgr_018003 [Nepenthes gracilis]